MKRAHTLQGVVLLRYRKMKHRVALQGWPEPDFTREEFLAWALMDHQLLQLFGTWERGGFRKWDAPSLDRINPARSYLRGNLRWITWKENWEKGIYQDHKQPPADAGDLPF